MTERLKDYECDACSEVIQVPADYEPKFCCSGYLCGCHGMNTDPYFCDECEEKIFGDD